MNDDILSNHNTHHLVKLRQVTSQFTLSTVYMPHISWQKYIVQVQTLYLCQCVGILVGISPVYKQWCTISIWPIHTVYDKLILSVRLVFTICLTLLSAY